MCRLRISIGAYLRVAISLGVLCSIALPALSEPEPAGEREEERAAGEEPAGDPQEPAVAFVLSDVTARPGETVSIGFQVRSDQALSLVAWSIEFDPQVLEIVDVSLHPAVEQLLQKLPAEAHGFRWVADNTAGWIQVSLVMDYLGREAFSIPPVLGVPLSRLDFAVRPDAPPGEHPLVFTRPDAAGYETQLRDNGAAVYNAARSHGRPFTPDDQFQDTMEPTYDDGTLYVPIIGDIGIFIRGDANLDLDVDISDPLRILNHLFRSGEPLPCPAAADANADGSVNLSDPVLLLDYLFRGYREWTPYTVYGSAGGEGEQTESACSL